MNDTQGYSSLHLDGKIQLARLFWYVFCSLIWIVPIIPDPKNISKYHATVLLDLTALFGADSFWELKTHAKCSSYLLVGLHMFRKVIAIH